MTINYEYLLETLPKTAAAAAAAAKNAHAAAAAADYVKAAAAVYDFAKAAAAAANYIAENGDLVYMCDMFGDNVFFAAGAIAAAAETAADAIGMYNADELDGCTMYNGNTTKLYAYKAAAAAAAAADGAGIRPGLFTEYARIAAEAAAAIAYMEG